MVAREAEATAAGFAPGWDTRIPDAPPGRNTALSATNLYGVWAAIIAVEAVVAGWTDSVMA